MYPSFKAYLYELSTVTFNGLMNTQLCWTKKAIMHQI